jgi:hypothetical protein
MKGHGDHQVVETGGRPLIAMAPAFGPHRAIRLQHQVILRKPVILFPVQIGECSMLYVHRF